jgi:hypothetical protein
MVPKINLDISRCRKYANPWEGSLSSARLEACAVLGSTGVFDELLGKFVDDVAPR